MSIITTENQYNDALELIETYLPKGSSALMPEEKQELKRLSLLVEAYELQVYPMPMPAQSPINPSVFSI